MRTVLSYGQQHRMQALYQVALSDTTKVSLLAAASGAPLADPAEEHNACLQHLGQQVAYHCV
jgi:hypothetical protein